MEALLEISFIKTKNGWIARDKNGNSASGPTRQIAKNNLMIQHLSESEFEIPEIEIGKYLPGLDGFNNDGE